MNTVTTYVDRTVVLPAPGRLSVRLITTGVIRNSGPSVYFFGNQTSLNVRFGDLLKRVISRVSTAREPPGGSSP